jgi:hypothetical protein
MLVTFRIVLLATSMVLVAAPAIAQSATPPRRAHHSLVYDEVGRRALLWGGSTPIDGGRSSIFFNDLWSFDGQHWTALEPSGEKASGAQFAWDAKRNRVVSFGGYNGRSLGDLRVLEGTTWRALGQHPELRAAEPGFVYDASRDRFVAFGGSSGPGNALGETWELDGTQWSKVSVPGPAPRQAHVMAFDAQRGRTVVFGGMGAAPPGQRPAMLGDTWEYDGAAWTQRHVAGPSPRSGAGAAFDSRRGIVVIFGGVGDDGFLGDTWSWNGTAWRKLADTGPEPRGMGYLVYDAHRDRIVLFGGRKGWPDGDLNDTWEWDGSVWRRVTDR